MKSDIQAFIIRIWHEARDHDGNSTIWRGSIDHVGTDRRKYFHDLNGALRFIHEETGIGDRKSISRWTQVVGSVRDWFARFYAKN